MALLDIQNPNVLNAAAGTPVDKMPPAGPHDRPELTNYDACPGAGALPSQREMGGETGMESDPGAG
jgi:hypothetical protein